MDRKTASASSFIDKFKITKHSAQNQTIFKNLLIASKVFNCL